MDKQPELSVRDFFALGNGAAAKTAALKREREQPRSTPARETR